MWQERPRSLLQIGDGKDKSGLDDRSSLPLRKAESQVRLAPKWLILLAEMV